MKCKVIITMALTVFSIIAFAQQGSIKLKNEAFQEIEVNQQNGEKEYKLVEPKKVVPGDEIFYVTTFTNISDKPATNIVINNPLPNNSFYKAGSAFGAGTEITFSADSGQTYAKAEALTVRTKDGGTRPATPKEYTHIRWLYIDALQPGAEGTVTFRTIIK